MKAGVIQNHLGYWVGTIEYPDGTIGKITNAKESRAVAFEIVKKIVKDISRKGSAK